MTHRLRMVDDWNQGVPHENNVSNDRAKLCGHGRKYDQDRPEFTHRSFPNHLVINVSTFLSVVVVILGNIVPAFAAAWFRTFCILCEHQNRKWIEGREQLQFPPANPPNGLLSSTGKSGCSNGCSNPYGLSFLCFCIVEITLTHTSSVRMVYHERAAKMAKPTTAPNMPNLWTV